MNWRQQLFDGSPLSRLVALQQALIRINSHSIIFSLSKHLCVSEPPVYSLNTQGQLLPSSMNRNSFLRLKVPIFSLSVCLLMPCVGKHKHAHYILPNVNIFFSYALQITVIHLLTRSTGFLSFVYSTMKKARISSLPLGVRAPIAGIPCEEEKCLDNTRRLLLASWVTIFIGTHWESRHSLSDLPTFPLLSQTTALITSKIQPVARMSFSWYMFGFF